MPPTTITTIYAKKRGSAPAIAEDGNEEARIAYLDVTIPPETPIHIGQRARILILISCDARFPSEEDDQPAYYVAEDIGMWGVFERIRVVEEELVEFVLKNANTRSRTTYAYVAVKKEENVTIRTTWWEWLARATIARPQKSVRRVPIEENAVVFEDLTMLNFSASTGARRRLYTAGCDERRRREA
ncbi:hypothetical protein OH77DRAFT_1417835 [Trametes cingulata]|nr:hypothetical protein OH77DRAFT_1417835 [Trametes cingulata]